MAAAWSRTYEKRKEAHNGEGPHREQKGGE